MNTIMNAIGASWCAIACGVGAVVVLFPVYWASKSIKYYTDHVDNAE